VNILGVSCYYHDSAACVVKEGRVVSAAQEERFNRVKNSPDFPSGAINYCVQSAGISFGDIDLVAFFEKPYLKFSRIVLSHLRAYPFSLRNFLQTTPHWLQERLIFPLVLEKEMAYKGRTLFIKHHLSHAASAFLVSPFDKAAILTCDGLGEWATMTRGRGQGRDIEVEKEIRYPHSLGLLYAAVTTYLGFRANRDEGKVMGLAAYGKSEYLDKFRQIIRTRPDGSFFIDESYFGFNRGTRMFSGRFVRMFGRPRREREPLEQRHYDMAASLQAFTEQVLVSAARDLHKSAGSDNLCMAGGVFLNCVANEKIKEETPFKDVFIQPAAGDSGGAMGAAIFAYNSVMKNPRRYVMENAYLGPGFTAPEIERALSGRGIAFRRLGRDEAAAYAAEKIAGGKIVGWFQGRMEFGPRALGNRSILADARDPNIKQKLNSRVKKRESFRPYAPSVLEEKAGDYFEMDGLSPFMLLAPRVKAGKAGVIPGVTHEDGTARVQTVSRKENPLFWSVIMEFDRLTGVPLVVNTSFNLRGEPIVRSPEEAADCYMKSGMDCLVIGNCVAEKAGGG